jgi:hypothetical protein
MIFLDPSLEFLARWTYKPNLDPVLALLHSLIRVRIVAQTASCPDDPCDELNPED